MVLTSPSLPTDQRGGKKSKSKFNVIRNFFNIRKKPTAGTSDVLRKCDIKEDELKEIDKGNTGSNKLFAYKESNGLCGDLVETATAGMDIQYGVSCTKFEVECLGKLQLIDQTTNGGKLYHEFTVKVQKPDCGVIGLVISSGYDVLFGVPIIQKVCKDSIAGKTGVIQAGDEILKVNGNVLSGLGHKNILELFNSEEDSVDLLLRRKMFGDNSWYSNTPYPLKKGFEEISIYDERFNIENKNYGTNNLTSLDVNTNMQGPLQFTTFKCGKARVRSTTSFKRVGDSIQITTELPNTPAKPADGCIDENCESQVPSDTAHRRTNSASASIRGRVDSNSQIKHESQEEYYQRGKSAPTSPAASLALKVSTCGTRQNNPCYKLRIYPTASEQKSKLAELRALTNVMTINNKKEQPLKESTTTTATTAAGLNKSPRIRKRFRDSFRLKKKLYVRKNDQETESNPKANDDDSDRRSGKVEVLESIGNKKTIAVTVHIPSIQGLGLNFGGGSTSIYGDSTLRIQSVSRSGTACGLLRPGDEVSEIDGSFVDDLTVFEAYKLLQSLVGRIIRIIVYRPARRTKSTKL